MRKATKWRYLGGDPWNSANKLTWYDTNIMS
jgi:hypothetical protein